MAGEIMAAIWCNCGRCGKAASGFTRDGQPLRNTPTQTHAEFVLRRDGWSKTVRDGWVCPECKDKKGPSR